MPDNAVSCPKTAQLSSIFELWGHRAVGHTDMPIQGLIDRQIYRLNKTLTIEILLTVRIRTEFSAGH